MRKEVSTVEKLKLAHEEAANPIDITLADVDKLLAFYEAIKEWVHEGEPLGHCQCSVCAALRALEAPDGGRE